MGPARALLVRSRLLERLGARWFEPVTAIVAPAGYGKTKVLSQAVAANAVAPVGFDLCLACTADLAVASRSGSACARAGRPWPAVRRRGLGAWRLHRPGRAAGPPSGGSSSPSSLVTVRDTGRLPGDASPLRAWASLTLRAPGYSEN